MAPSWSLPIVLLLVVTLFHAEGHGPDVVKTTAREGDNVVLECNVERNMKGKLVDWKKILDDEPDREVFLYDQGLDQYAQGTCCQDPVYKGRVSHFDDLLAEGKVSIRIRDVRIQDAGTYTCTIPSFGTDAVKCQVELSVEPVFKKRLGQGAAWPPYTKALEPTAEGVPLQCLVRGAYPEPVVEWHGDDGKPLTLSEEPRVTKVGDRFEVAVRTLVTKPGPYTCVVKQEELHHVTQDTLTVSANGPFCEKPSDPGVPMATVVIIAFITTVSCLIIGYVVGVYLPPRHISSCCAKKEEGGAKEENGNLINEERKPRNDNGVTYHKVDCVESARINLAGGHAKEPDEEGGQAKEGKGDVINDQNINNERKERKRNGASGLRGNGLGSPAKSSQKDPPLDTCVPVSE